MDFEKTTLNIRGSREVPDVRAKLPAEAGFVRPVRDDSTSGANWVYKACLSGSV